MDKTKPILLVAITVVLGATLLFGTLASTAKAAPVADNPAQGAPASRVLAGASLYDCIILGRNLGVFYRTWNPYYAVLAAMRVGGCGDAAANYICYASQQWWGAPFRGLVWLVTWGRYTRC